MQVHFRLDFIMEANSLTLVHVVCNIGYLRTQADERVDNKYLDQLGKRLEDWLFSSPFFFLVKAYY